VPNKTEYKTSRRAIFFHEAFCEILHILGEITRFDVLYGAFPGLEMRLHLMPQGAGFLPSADSKAEGLESTF
jgi:hypothetical protein